MKGIILLCGLFAASFALSLTGLFTGSSASAQSAYDSVITQGSGYVKTSTCDIDLALTYTNVFSNPDAWYKDNWGNDLSTNRTIFQARFNESMNSSNGIWGLVQSETKRNGISYQFWSGSQGDKFLILYFSPHSTTTEFKQTPNGSALTLNGEFYEMVIGVDESCAPYVYGASHVTTQRYFAYADSSTAGEALYRTSNPVFIKAPFTYPNDYDGVIIPDTYSPPNPSNGAFSPDITYSYDDLDLDFYSDSAKNNAKLDDYYVYWFISNSTTDGVQPSESYGMSGCTPPDETSQLQVPIYGEYTLQAYYADTKCNILNKDNDGNILTDSVYVFNIDGGSGSGSVGGADDRNIEENKLVSAIRNINVDDHGLQTLILAPAQLFTQMATWSGSCSSITMPFLNDKSLKLECVRGGFSSSYPVIYGVIQVIIGGLIAYFVAVKTFAIVKQSNDPEDDKIEVNKL